MKHFYMTVSMIHLIDDNVWDIIRAIRANTKRSSDGFIMLIRRSLVLSFKELRHKSIEMLNFKFEEHNFPSLDRSLIF